MKNMSRKAFMLCAVLCVVLIALWFVSDIVHEREARMHAAQYGIVDGLSGPQTIVGPILQRTCEETWTAQETEDDVRKTVTHKRPFQLRSLPKTLDVKASAPTSQRTRGIFKVNTYDLSTTATATWSDLNALLSPSSEFAGRRIVCEPVQIVAAVGDSRGIRLAAVSMNNKALDVLPGTGITAFNQGFHAQLPVAEGPFSQPLQLTLQMELTGTGALAFTPLGDKTTIELSSNWPSPSFVGRFLPSNREVDAKGFKAKWQLSALASTARQAFLEGAALCDLSEGTRNDHCVETMGLNFMDPVNVYSLTNRATKYGILFIGLTFIGVVLVEVVRQLRVHPIQYLLVGAALCLFFLLLVSLSEHLSFGVSYAVASAACSVLLAFYGSFVLRGVKAGIVFGCAVGALYGTLYVLLQQEQTALLLGSVLLFTVLAIIMFATRRIDWYQYSAAAEKPANA